MSVGRPNSSLIITPEVYEANRAKIEAAKAALQAAEMKNEQGRKNHEQMAAELRAQIQAGEEARRALEQLEAARNNPASQNVLGPVNPPLIEHPTYDAAELATTSRIEEVPVHNSTYSSSPHTQSSWPASISQNGSYATNNSASYGAPSMQTHSNSHATNGFAGSGSSAGNPYLRQLNNQMYQPHVQPVTQHRRTSYGSVLQTYPTTQQQFQQYAHQTTQPYTKPQQVPQARMSTHASAFSPSNHQAEQRNSQYSGDLYNYNAQQSQQHPNKSQGTAAATFIGRQRAYQPASGSSSLDGALTPAGQSVGQVNTQHIMEDGKPPQTSSTQLLSGLNSEPTPAGSSNEQVAPQRSTENTKQPQTSTSYPSSSSIAPSSGSSSAATTFQSVPVNSFQQYTNKPHAQPNTFNSHPTASNSPSTQMSESSTPASPQSLIQQASHYVMLYASRWGEMAPPNSFVNLPQLPQYKLYKGFDCRLRVGVERSERTVLISLDEFLSKELPALVAKHGIQAHTLQPGHVGTSSAATSAPSYISKVPAVPSLPASVSASSRTPSHVTLSAQSEIPRTPAQVDKKHLARDILRALKRRRPSDSNEREPKKHASASSVLTYRTNVEDMLVKHYTTTAPPPTETIVGTTILTSANSAHTLESGIIRAQSPALSASIPISSPFRKPPVPPASVPDSVISSNSLAPHPPSPEVESNGNDNILPHDAPVTSIPKDNDIIVIEDSQPGTPGIGEIPKDKEQPRVAQRSLSPEIPVPSPVMKSQALSVLPLPSTKPSVSQADYVNLGRESQTGRETSKPRRPIPYVLVPPPPEYVILYKKHLKQRGSTSNGAQPGLSSRTKSKGSFNGGVHVPQ